MIKVAAVDDEMHVLERFERIAKDMKELQLCGLFQTGEELLSYIKSNKVDAVFLDIEMPGTIGLVLAQEILDIDENISIVFVTAFNQYAVEAFEVCAMDYIMKPLTEERLAKTMERLIKSKNTVKTKDKPFVECFGSFEVFVNGEVIIWKNAKAKELLAFLIHKNGLPVDWEKIADALWPDYNSEKAHINLHTTTYLLRKNLAQAGIGDIFESRRGNYRVVVEKVECDIYKLEELIKNKEIKKEENFWFIDRFKHRGYMEENGYDWAYPRSAELNNLLE